MIVVTWHELGKPPRLIEFQETQDPFEILQRCITRIDAMDSSPPAQAPCTARSDSLEVQVATPPGSTPATAHSGPPGKSRGGEYRLPAQPAPDGVRDSSMIAYRSLEWSGRMTKQQRLVMDFFAINAQRNYTRQELANATGLGIPAICGRVNELLKSPFSLLEELPRRRCRITGESSHPLRAREKIKVAA